MKNKEQIIKSCGFSEEMERYLINYKPNDFEMLEIILGAPIPLTEKRELLELLNTPDSKAYDDVSKCINEFDDALAELELEYGEMFTLSECWYDDDILDENKSFAEPFLSFQAAVEYIEKMIEEETEDMEAGEEYECWTEIRKWIPVGEGKMKDVYIYTFVGNEIHYFRRIVNPPRKRFRWHRNSLDLNLPIPFKPGDIVNLNTLPFRPVKHAVIIEVLNDYDCCGTTIMYQAKHGSDRKLKWETGALKHGDGWEGFFPMLSSLYRLSKYEGELSKEERLMKDVRQYVLKDEGNGRKLWNFMYKSFPSETELSEFLEKNI